MDTTELKEQLREKLENKRYLLIIDDIWNIEAWNAICKAFSNNEKGSRVVLTTRNKEVVVNVDPLSRNHVEIRLLNEDESWELFGKKVFSGRSCPLELVTLGKEIVNKCGGLPLGIIVIGGLLMGKERTPSAWSKVLDSATWQLSQHSNQCREILFSSYIDLPYYLKSCFLYLGLFPEDFEIKAQKLILLWVAEGFVKARGEENLEDVAEDCLEELIQRSMIQVTRRIYPGGPVETCRVHDLLRDLAISEAKMDRFLDIQTNKNSSSKSTTSRRFTIHLSDPKNFHTTISPKIRSLLVFDQFFKIGMWKSTFGDGKTMLRVLDLEGIKIGKAGLPNEIEKLIFLQYLGLYSTGLQTLPASIGSLLKLQTLDIRSTFIKRFPRALLKMKNLRHMFLSRRCKKFEKGNTVMIKEFGKDLLTLHASGGMWMTADGGLSDVIFNQRCLRSLEVFGEIKPSNHRIEKANCFSSSLAELCLYFSGFQIDPSVALGSLRNLKTLSLYSKSYMGMEMDFKSGFPQLHVLNLVDLEDLT